LQVKVQQLMQILVVASAGFFFASAGFTEGRA
jgi:hypothetical protein